MSEDWLTELEPVYKAETQAECEAVYRFRYRVYVKELHLEVPEANHPRKRLYSQDDDRIHATIFYTGTPKEITGTVRIRTWAPGEVPEKESKWLSMERFSGIARLTTAEIEHLVIRSDQRGKLIVPALVCAAYEFLAGEKNADLAFWYSWPGHVRLYRMIGAVPYGGSLVAGGVGSLKVPLVLVLSDIAHLERSGSFLAPLVKKYFGPGKRKALDMTPFRRILETEQIPVESDPAKIWQAVQAHLLEKESSSTCIDSLSSRSLQRLTQSGFLLNLRAGELAVRKGSKEREVYVILEGVFEVFQGTRRIALRTKGDLIGEIAFFTQAGQRTASVRALTNGRVLVLQHKFLKEFTLSDPEAGYQILMNMNRVMAERLAEMMQAL